MKKQFAMAAVLTAALCIAPLAACDGTDPKGKPFEMADYALELPISFTTEYRMENVAEYASVKQIDGLRLSGLSSYYGHEYSVAVECGTGENSGLIRLYSLKEERAVSDEWYASYQDYNNGPFLLLACETGEGYRLATPTGEIFPAQPIRQSDLSFAEGTYSPEPTRVAPWYSVTYPMENGSTQTKYIGYDQNEWKNLTEANVKQENAGSGYKPGDTLGLSKTPICNLSAHPNYLYKDYSYVSEGSGDTYCYTFYRGEEKIGSVTVFGDAELGVLGQYFYYYSITAVSANAERGYNVEITQGSTTYKADLTLYRFNFTNGKNEKVESNYFFMPISSSAMLYNNRTNDFDRMAVAAYKKTDGVAVVSEYAPQYTFILDENAHISLDLTAKNAAYTFYRLSDDRFLSGYTIFDKEMNTVAQLPDYREPIVWKEQSLILASLSYSSYLAVDYNGKVVLAGLGRVTESGAFISGGNLVARGQDGEMLVFSGSAPGGKTLQAAIGAGKDASVYSAHGLLYTLEETDSYVPHYTFYNCSGTKLGEFHCSFQDVSYGTYYRGKYFCTATDEEGNYLTLLFK